jgi:hypothetical protein
MSNETEALTNHSMAGTQEAPSREAIGLDDIASEIHDSRLPLSGAGQEGAGMNRMKTAFKSIRNYLGRDAKGIELLQRAESIADELRKENARLRQESEEASRIASEQKASRLESDNLLSRERDLRQSMEARLAQSEATVKRLMTQLQPPAPPDAKEPLNEEKAIARQIKTLKTSGFKWPPRYLIRDVEKQEDQEMPIECYDVADVIRNWSGAELLKLGQFVALEAVATVGLTVFYSSQKCLDKNESTTRRLLGLLENFMTTAAEDEREAEFIGSKAQPPQLRAIERL